MQAIQAVGISKRYRIGQREAYGALRDTLARALSAPARAFRRAADRKAASEASGHFWALKDVSFDVAQGEIVAIIGRNGSGKSTLLKILSRITEPTSGSAAVRGRVGSLLEVGTGFHPELTGRENVFVNGAILGMKRRDILRRFDEIVAFADIDRFIDTPVKHYSSGMQMRLAFAVAAHLEPEILLVDEVLAVGDVAFQKKCIGKMDDVSRQGRTVLLVSHQLNQLRRLCRRGVWLDAGRVVEVGAAADVVSRYEAALMAPVRDEARGEIGSAAARFVGWDFADGTAGHVLTSTGPCAIRFRLHLMRPVTNGYHGIALYDRDDRLLWGTDAEGLTLGPGLHEIVYWIEGLPVRPGPYRWHIALFENHVQLDSLFCVPEMIVATNPTGHRRDECAGVLNIQYQMRVGAAEDAEATAAQV